MEREHGRMRIAVIGGGRIGFLHAQNVHRNADEMELAAVVEPRPSPELSRWAASRSIPLARDVVELAALAPGASGSAPELDAILIATPTDTHGELVRAAARCGVHVFCEKPIAPDLEATHAVLKEADRAGVVFQVGFNRRYDHNFRAIRDAVEAGTIGEIELVHVISRDPAPPPLEYVRHSGGLFADMAIHDFDMVRYLSGQEVASVFARGACLVDPAIGEAGDIDTAVVSLRFASGALGTIENSRRAAYGYDQRASVFGSRGALESANDTASTVILSDGDGVHAERPLHFFLERYRASFERELLAFAASVKAKTPPEVTGNDGLQAMRLALACNRSLLARREVQLEEI